MPVQSKEAKKLVLARETLRTLARPRSNPDQVVAVVTSCGDVCTCACGTETY
ncbi:MAG TPA: hypothetical protein VF615_07230 [Longimicrobiaceae bacterium]|jgi:hypothetical protein